MVDHVSLDDPLMGEEIFGPILPILTFKSREEAVEMIRENPTPLATYIFTTNQDNREYFMNQVRFGGGCVNDTIIHLATSHMGFGGTGTSGMGLIMARGALTRLPIIRVLWIRRTLLIYHFAISLIRAGRTNWYVSF